MAWFSYGLPDPNSSYYMFVEQFEARPARDVFFFLWCRNRLLRFLFLFLFWQRHRGPALPRSAHSVCLLNPRLRFNFYCSRRPSRDQPRKEEGR